MSFDIDFLLYASDNSDEEWLIFVSDGITDYLLSNGHDVVSTINSIRCEVGIELIGFGSDDLDEPETLRIAMELLDDAAKSAKVSLNWEGEPRKRWHTKAQSNVLTRRTTRISA